MRHICTELVELEGKIRIKNNENKMEVKELIYFLSFKFQGSDHLKSNILSMCTEVICSILAEENVCFTGEVYYLIMNINFQFLTMGAMLQS